MFIAMLCGNPRDVKITRRDLHTPSMSLVMCIHGIYLLCPVMDGRQTTLNGLLAVPSRPPSLSSTRIRISHRPVTSTQTITLV